MKTTKNLLITTILSFGVLVCMLSFKYRNSVDAKEIIGAWGFGPAENRTIMINTDKVFSVVTYDLPGRKFISSYGGTWKIDGNKLIRKIEWDSKDSLNVGKEITHDIQVAGTNLLIAEKKEKWDRLDNGTPGKLMGAWVITGNYKDDKVSKRSSPFYPQRTMKVLSGKHFHWIAYNVQKKQFINAGGGTYTTENGKYTEKIDFFTKTPESVGKSLSFDYSFVDGDWRHKGEKSTGGPMDECWSKRETLEKM